MKGFLMSHILSFVVGPLVGLLVTFASEGIQKTFPRIDALGPLAKRIGIGGIAVTLGPLAQAFGFTVPAACATNAVDLMACAVALADKGWLTGAIGVVVAFATHQIAIAGKTPTQ